MLMRARVRISRTTLRQPDLLVDRLMIAINQIANTPYPLAQRQQQIAELEREIDRLQRTEEAIVVATGAGLATVGRAGGEP
jgi:endonuclease/exonuclease/phosphatase (EEP) superfamily protein YafD